MSGKTNAARVLDRLAIAYALHTYAPDAGDLSPGRLARELGMPPDQIWKTLVARGERTGPLFAVIPVAAKLDLKALAALAGDKRVELLPLAQVQAHTGYVRGAVTALAAKKAYPVFVDAACNALTRFGVSAGALGLELVLTPADYVRATSAQVGPIAEPERSPD